MVKDIVKYTVLGIFLLLAWLFRKTIIAIVKKLARIVNEADEKLVVRVGK